MAKAKKTRANKYEEKLKIDGSFADVIKVSLNKKHMEKKNQDDLYRELYLKINDEVIAEGIKKGLMGVCSVMLDFEDKTQINVQFLGVGDTWKEIPEVKSRFDKYAPEYGFTVKYVNLSGDLSTFDKK